jgi:hypothetical protein
VVVDFLKKKIPAAAPEIDMLLSSDANVQAAENVVNDVSNMFSKKK